MDRSIPGRAGIATVYEQETRIAHIDRGFDFLGWNFRKHSGKLFIKPSEKDVNAFYEKLGNLIGNGLGITKQDLILSLNPMLRGWAHYHSLVVAEAAASWMEWVVLYWRLWRRAKRRNPAKRTDWIRRKYWRSVDGRNLVFACEVATKDGGKGAIEMNQLSGTAIERQKSQRNLPSPRPNLGAVRRHFPAGTHGE